MTAWQLNPKAFPTSAEELMMFRTTRGIPVELSSLQVAVHSRKTRMGKLRSMESGETKTTPAPARPAPLQSPPLAKEPEKQSPQIETERAPSSAPKPSLQNQAPADPNERLALSPDKSVAFQNVFKSITQQKKNQASNTFPFDFSTESTSDYTERLAS